MISLPLAIACALVASQGRALANGNYTLRDNAQSYNAPPDCTCPYTNILSGSGSADGPPPKVGYWHLYTDDNGITHQARCQLTDFKLAAIASGASPEWLGQSYNGNMTTLTGVLPVGWVAEWHPNPKPQWIIPLSGRWFVESMDGQRIEMGPGEFSFGEDQGTATVDGKTGHRSGTVGDEPCVQLIVQMETRRARTTSCPFK